ncbi:MAG TPA: TlpA disulfide reductase family protein [Puia sp.]|jgi:thiol-disulfide isomerase/thioredoxin|nr:TlpA disulfide reductase family protein [Puia sp.]
MISFKWQFIVALFFICNLVPKANATVHQAPNIGKLCPDFKLTNLVNSKKKQVTLKDFRGKWLMIDFWANGCPACVEKMPKVNRLQQMFRKDLTVLLIGYNDYQYDRHIKKMYLQIQDRLHLQMLAAFDSVLLRRWNAYSLPHIYLIDPMGVVYTITPGVDLDSAKIRQLIDGKKPSFQLYGYTRKYDWQHPLLINNNGGPDTGFVYRSLLTRYVDEDPIWWNDIGNYIEKNKTGFQITGASLSKLYQYAYFGKVNWGLNDTFYSKVSPELDLEISDSSDFKKIDFKTLNLFNYSLFVPPGKANVNYLMQVLQRELKNYFGYEASIENREMPCWLLQLRKDTTVLFKPTKSTRSFYEDAMGMQIDSGQLAELIFGLSDFCPLDRLTIYDETGINYPIDIEFKAFLTDFNEVQQELHNHGLELVRGKKWMKTIVIRDPAP